MRASVENITPERAAEMLRHNDHNRKLSDAVAKRYADEMTRGAWLDNGSAIVLNGTLLLDGQHRLAAVVRSGIAREFVVVRDVSPSAFATIDTGSVRRLKDVLSIEKEESANVLAAALNSHRAYTSHGSLVTTGSYGRLTYAEMLEYHRSNPQVRRSVDYVIGLKGKPLVGKGLLAALHALFSMKDPRTADDFVYKFVSGSGLVDDDPVKTIRDRFIENETSRHGAGKLTPVMRGTALIQAWNAVRGGYPVKRIQVLERGKRNRVRRIQIK